MFSNEKISIIDQYRQLRLIDSYFGGMSHDVTEHAQWAISDDAVASVEDSAGVIKE